MRKPYPSDLTDEQWAILEPMIPVHRVGRPRKVDMREVLNAIFYLNRSGCQWDMLPHDLPAKSTVYDHFAQWRDDGTWQAITDALRRQVRVAGGADPPPRVASIGRQTGKAVGPAVTTPARVWPASTVRRSRPPRSPTVGGTTGAS